MLWYEDTLTYQENSGDRQLALSFTIFHKFSKLDIEILTYSYLNLKVRIQRRLTVCLLKKKKNLCIWGPVQFKSAVFKGQLYSLCWAIGDLSIHWLWYPQSSQNPPRILRQDCNCITFSYLSNTKITWLSKCGPQANSSTTWNVLEVQILRPHWRLPSHRLWDGYAAVCFPGGSDGKESACNAGDPGLIPGLGRSLREGNGNPLQYSCLENSIDRAVHSVAKSHAQLKD